MLFFYVLLSISILGWILYPVLFKNQETSGDPLLQERIQSAEAALEQLYSQGKHKISEEDFPKIERHLLVSLARLLKRAGMPPHVIAAKAAMNDDEAESAAETKVEATTPTKEHSFCGSCGQPNEGSFAFCPSCGKRLNAA